MTVTGVIMACAIKIKSIVMACPIKIIVIVIVIVMAACAIIVMARPIKIKIMVMITAIAIAFSTAISLFISNLTSATIMIMLTFADHLRPPQKTNRRQKKRYYQVFHERKVKKNPLSLPIRWAAFWKRWRPIFGVGTATEFRR